MNPTLDEQYNALRLELERLDSEVEALKQQRTLSVNLETSIDSVRELAIRTGAIVQRLNGFIDDLSNDLNEVEKRMGLDTRSCPKCGKLIRSTSNKCRTCGVDVNGQA